MDNAGTTAAAAVTEADRVKGLGYHASMTTGEAGMAGCRFFVQVFFFKGKHISAATLSPVRQRRG